MCTDEFLQLSEEEQYDHHWNWEAYRYAMRTLDLMLAEDPRILLQILKVN